LYRYAQDLPVTTEWSAECFALAVFSSRILTFGPLGVALVALVLAVLIARRTPMHPYNPLTAGLSLPRGVRLRYTGVKYTGVGYTHLIPNLTPVYQDRTGCR
jgi:hypothetical protein